MALNLFRSVLLLCLSFCLSLKAQKKGCTDRQAVNYDGTAQINDGSCLYPITSGTPVRVCQKLSDSLTETSGLIFFDNRFWTINDSGNEPAVYAFDSMNGTITCRILIRNQVNTDWEEITQDDSNIYIGDFGNNNGDRKDLKILMIRKTDLLKVKSNDSVNAAVIQFSYADQLSYTPASQNHNFDMEAMCAFGDSLHLFSKDWVDKKTRHYVLPASPGNYNLSPRESIAVDGQITSAACRDSGKVIVLGGYNTSNGACFLWMLWNFKDPMVFSGNKRRIELGNALTLGQYEASAFNTAGLYLTNEKRYTNAALWRMGIDQWLNNSNTGIKIPETATRRFNVYQKHNDLIVETVDNEGTLLIYNASGTLVMQYEYKTSASVIPLAGLASGIYTVENNGFFKKILIQR